jgi:ribonuclease HII
MALTYQRKFEKKGFYHIAGVDEAGRGPLAGPLVCAAVIFSPSFRHALINDSKQLTDQERRKLFPFIMEHALSVSYQMIEPEIIDRLNIYRATQQGMMTIIQSLTIKPDFVITDAMKLPTLDIPYEPLIKGDTKALPVAAASIIAKVIRDDYMLQLHEQYPHFQFHLHKGYPTPLHLTLLKRYGPLKGIHRFSYRPVQEALNQKVFLI